MHAVMKAVDKANGYMFGPQERATLSAMMSTAMGADFDFFKYPALLLRVRVCVCVCVSVYPFPSLTLCRTASLKEKYLSESHSK